MNHKTFLAAVFVFFSFVLNVPAQSTSPQNIPEGMEAVQIGGSGWLIVPKGAKTRKVGAQIIVEGTKEYTARRLEEMDKRLTSIETALGALKKELEALRAGEEKKEPQGLIPASK